MLIKQAPDIESNEITDRSLYLRRRDFMGAAALTGPSLLWGARLAASAALLTGCGEDTRAASGGGGEENSRAGDVAVRPLGGPDELLEAMARGDAPRLQSIPGVGKKTAERIALELRDKALKMSGDQYAFPSQVPPPEDKKVYEDAVSALINLGYSQKSAKEAVDRARPFLEDVSLESWIKAALKRLA